MSEAIPAARIAPPLPILSAEATITSRLRELAAHRPTHLAIRDGETDVTYAELDRLSDGVAAAIRGRLDGSTGVVGLLLPHDRTALVGMLGIFKSGAVFVPLDPSWPPAHVEEILAHSEAGAVVTDEAGAALVSARGGWRGEIIPFEDSLGAWSDPLPAPEPTDPAVLYYSSGSTGKPKGILLRHASLWAMACTYVTTLGIAATDRLVWLVPIPSGASSMPILGGFVSGACVLPYAIGARGLHPLGEWMARERITVLSSTPTVFRQLARGLPEGANLPDLRAVKLGGEPVLRSDVDLFRRRVHGGCALWNGLGITETAGNVCFYRWPGDALPEGPTLPLGWAVPGVTISIVDEERRPVAAGEAGEIAVRSPRLAFGYWRLPDVTRARFLEPDRPGEPRTFLTGDRGRLGADGCLVGLGRVDRRLKIRGHAVDPAEIESALLDLDAVANAVVIAKRVDGAEKLAAFVVPTEGRSPTPADLRRQLRRRLPAAKVPAFVTVLPDFPRLPGGKVDVSALAALEPPPETAEERVAPRDALELELARIWARALRRKGVGVTDDFFDDLGGDSLDAARIFAMMERWLRVSLPLVELARHPTIESLAAAIREWEDEAPRSRAILLNAGENAIPLFFVPGAGSDVFALLDLARHLGPEQTLYGLEHAADQPRPAFLELEEMARRNLEHVRKIQPVGPYLFGGTSFGGVVAYEMARQLEEGGETVALLALVEAYGRNYPRLRRGRALRHFPSVLLRWLRPIGRKEEPTWKNLKLGLREHFDRLRADAEMHLGLRQGPPPFALRFLYLQQICFRAHRRYRFPPYHGRIVLFRAERQPPAAIYDLRDDLGWGAVARGGVEIHTIPGYHGAHMREPNVPVLAAKLREAIAAATGGVTGRFSSLTPRTREIWNRLGAWWDREVGDEGSPSTRDLLVPATDALVGLRPGERVLDVACGNGWYGRRLARAGAEVVGLDFSEVLVDFARSRAVRAGIAAAYHVVDATDRDRLLELGERSFDAAVCLMALADMTDVEPLFEALARLVKPRGRFVFSIPHPESGGLAAASPGEVLTSVGLSGQPVPSYYFHRPLATLVDLAGRHGWKLEASERCTDERDGGPAFFIARLRLA